MTYLTQDRFVEATTSFDANTLTVSAPDFSPFVETIDLEVEFESASGGVDLNRAVAGIDCEIDPNRIRLFGTLAGAGGLAAIPGSDPDLVSGNAVLFTSITFNIDTDTPFLLSALPRPSTDPRDRFRISFKRDGGGGEFLFLLDQDDPAQSVDFAGILTPGDYEVEFEAELTVEGDEQSRSAAFTLWIPLPASWTVPCIGAWALRRRRAVMD